MSDSQHIVCPHCHSTNRIPLDKNAMQAKCGSCKQAVFDGHPATLNESNFDSHLQNNDIPMIVDFWAEWCGPCKTMGPVFEQAAQTLQPQIRFAKVDTDENQRLASRFQIRGIPTLIIYKNGNEVDRRSGAIPPAELQSWIQQHI